MTGGNILIKRPHFYLENGIWAKQAEVLLCFSRGSFGLENNCLSTILRNSEDQCSPSKVCVWDILLRGLVSPSPAWRVLCPALHKVCLNEMGWQSEEKPLRAPSPKFYNSKVWSPAPSPSQGGIWQAQGVKATQAFAGKACCGPTASHP